MRAIKSIVLGAMLFTSVFISVTLLRAPDEMWAGLGGVGLSLWILVALIIENRLPVKGNMRARWLWRLAPLWVLTWLGLIVLMERTVAELGRIYSDLGLLSWDARFFGWLAPQGQIRFWFGGRLDWVWMSILGVAVLWSTVVLIRIGLSVTRAKYWSADLSANRLDAVWTALSTALLVHVWLAFAFPALGPAHAFPELFQELPPTGFELNRANTFPALGMTVFWIIGLFAKRWFQGWFGWGAIGCAFLATGAGLFLGFHYIAGVVAGGLCVALGLQVSRWRHVI